MKNPGSVVKYVITTELVKETKAVAKVEKNPQKKIMLYKKARFFEHNIGKFLVKVDKD
tara:strand:- start:1982 stop:2155 length:174 start_codon:yes stop_codon:yes gene_type:complete